MAGIRTVVVASVALFVAALLLPEALSAIANSTTTNWNAGVITIFQILLPILAVIGIALKFFSSGKG